jgi:hypothetical protein
MSFCGQQLKGNVFLEEVFVMFWVHTSGNQWLVQSGAWYLQPAKHRVMTTSSRTWILRLSKYGFHTHIDGGFQLAMQCHFVKISFFPPPPHTSPTHFNQSKHQKCSCSSFRWNRSHNYKVEIWDWKKHEREFITSTPYLIAIPASVSSLSSHVCHQIDLIP